MKWLVAALAVVFAPPGKASAQADIAPPIRVVRVGYGDVAKLKEYYVAKVQGCRVVNKLPQGPVKLPSDDVIAKTALFETEELFDGQMWAEYRTQRSFAADAGNHCQLVLFVQRNVTVDRSCESRLLGSTTPLIELENLDTPAKPQVTIEQEKLGASSCRGKHAPDDVSGLPTEDAGNGVRCVWSSAIIARAMSKVKALADAAKSPGTGKEADFCLYAKRPTYYYQGLGRTVVLKSKGELGPNAVPTLTGEAPALAEGLSGFTDGQPIPAARFTRAAVESFLSQPAKVAVGVQ